MKIKNIILTLCCITLGLVLNIGTAFAYGDGVSDYKRDNYWLQYSYGGKTYYISKQDYDSIGGNPTALQLVSQYQRTNTSTIRPGTSTSHLSEGVLNMYNGYVKIDPSVFYDANAGDSNLNYLKDAAIMYMDMSTYKQLSAAYGANINAKTILDSYSVRTITEDAYKEISNIVEEGFESLARENYNKGYIEFSATAPSLTDLADAAEDNSIYFYCDTGPNSGQYGHAENYATLYYYIKDVSKNLDATFEKEKIDSTDSADSMVFTIESASSNVCSINAMIGVIKDTLLFTGGEISIVEGMLQALIPIAYCLMVLYFVLEIANIASRDITNISAEIYIKAFAKLIIAVLIIGNSYKIIIYGANLANGLTDLLLDTAESAANLPKLTSFIDVALRVDTSGLMDCLKSAMSVLSSITSILLIPFNFIVIIILSVQCYSRKIEFLLRSLFLPMAIADIAGKGLESSGMRYLRKLVAVGFHGAGIIGLAYIASELQRLSGGATDIVITLALLGSISLVKAAINEMMGV